MLDQVTIWLRPDDAAALQPAAGRRAPGDAMVDWVVGHASRHLRSLVELGTLLRALEPGPGGTQLVADLLLNREVVLEFLAGLASDGFPVGPNVEVVLGAIRDILSNEGAPGPRDLIARIRERLGRDLCRALAAENGRLPVLMLSPELEKLLSDNLVTGRAGGWALDGLSRGWCQRLEAEVREAFEAALHVDGVPPVLLCASELRGPLARLFAEAVPRLRTLAVNELSLESVEPVGAGVIDLSVHWGAWAA